MAAPGPPSAASWSAPKTATVTPAGVVSVASGVAAVRRCDVVDAAASARAGVGCGRRAVVKAGGLEKEGK